MSLKTDYKDDMFAGARKYRRIDNDDNTISLVDMTEYTQEGDRFGANDLNAITEEVNRLGESVSNGKAVVAAAITGKGQATAPDAAFQVMADNISRIETESVLTGNVTPPDVLSGKTFYSTNPKNKQTGTLALTGNANPADVLPNKTFYNTNPKSKNTGTMKTQAGKTIRPSTALQVAIPAGTYALAAINVEGSANLKPENVVEGIDIFGVKGTAKVKGIQVYTTSGVFIVPPHVYSIEIWGIGGGGAGRYSRAYKNDNGSTARIPGGGGGSGYTRYAKISVTPGQQIVVTIGAGGVSTASPPSSTAGGTTTVTRSGVVLISAPGGQPGDTNFATTGSTGGAGGSGGGDGGFTGRYAGRGGENGSNGWRHYFNQVSTKAIGQGTTTRAFGDADGTMYGGGGTGGGGVHGDFSGDRGTSYQGSAGGGGAGGRYGISSTTGLPGGDATPGTGSGGGGAGSPSNYTWEHNSKGGNGAGGCVMFRWGYK